MTEYKKGDHLTGLKIVLTGDFDSYSRADATAKLEALGADVTGSVSGKTMVVFVGENAGSKVDKAKSRGIPLFGEAEMLALIDGKTLDDLLVAAQNEAPSAAAVEMPIAEMLPKNGTYATHYEGTEQVHITGEYVDGLKHGSWKEYWPDGQLKQDYEWERGLKHGHELDWNEAGVQTCDGVNNRHVRNGKWTWWHANGEYMHAYGYDEKGLRTGPYEWNTDDGKPRARGQFWRDKFDGQWEWHNEPNHQRMTRGYRHGTNHGEDVGWFHGGQLAYRRNYWDGDLHGEVETYYADGKPQSRQTWNYGVPVGDHHSWDSEGNDTITTYKAGLSEIPSEKKLASLVKKLAKAKDSYKKHDVIGDVVEYGERGALVYHLWKSGLVDVPNDPELWELLFNGSCGLLDGDEMVEFLKTSSNKGYSSILPYWANDLDKAVMQVYARDPEPIDAAWESLPAKNRKGVALVRARFGRDVGTILHGEIKAMAEQHATNYGIGYDIWWPNEDGFVERQRLYDNATGEPTALFDTFIDFFGGAARWQEALRPHAEAEAAETVSRVSFTLMRPVIEAATTDEMKVYAAGISLDGNTHRLLHDSLREWRKDDGETMAEIAIGITEDGLRKWPAVCAAVLKLADEGKAIPQDLVDAFELDLESPTYSSSWCSVDGLPEEFRESPAHIAAFLKFDHGASVPRDLRVHEALSAMTEEQVRSVFERYLASDYRKTYPAPYLYLVDEPSLWERVIEVAEQDSYGHQPRTTWAFGEIGLPVVPLLEAAMARATTKDFQRGWAQALVCALTRAAVDGVEIPPAYDKYVRFDAMADETYYRSHAPFLQRLIHLLPTERAEPILIDALGSSHYWRALRAIGSHPTPAVLEIAFRRLLELESSMNYEKGQDLTFALKSLPNTRDWAKWVLMSGGGGGCRDALKSAVGWKEFEAIEAELAAAGVEKARELDAIDKVVALTEKSDRGEKMYLLRRLEATTGATLNVIGGAAPGVDATRWPMMDDEPMAHLFTLDLATMPELAAAYNARAMSVFCAQPGYNEAWEPDNEWTAIVFSTADELGAAGAPPDGIDPEHEATFEPVVVHADMSDDAVRSAIYRCGARVLGDPIWLQSDDYWGDFVMQFDESFNYMNLGDGGVMYVFSDTAFWQCH